MSAYIVMRILMNDIRLEKLLALIFCFFSITSCGKKFEYIPLEASAVSNTLYLTIEDRNGDNLISNHLFIENIRIYSEESKKQLEKKIVEIDGIPTLSISVPLPNEKQHQIKGTSQEKIRTKINLFYKGKGYEILCVFSFHRMNNAPDGMLGDTSISLHSIIFNGEAFNPKELKIALDI